MVGPPSFATSLAKARNDAGHDHEVEERQRQFEAMFGPGADAADALDQLPPDFTTVYTPTGHRRTRSVNGNAVREELWTTPNGEMWIKMS